MQPDDDGTDSAFVSQLRVIEDQPLDARAAAFVRIHDRLQQQLEGSDQADVNA